MNQGFSTSEDGNVESTTVNKILANVQGYYSGDYDWNDFYGDDEDELSCDCENDVKLDSSSILFSSKNKFDSAIQDKLKVFQTNEKGNSRLGDIKYRQRIRHRRKRDKGNEDDNPDFFHDEIVEQIQKGEDLLTIAPEEMNEIRQNAWIPRGEYIPDDIAMGYHTAWDIGKRGCVAVKLVGDWDSHISPNKVRFFVMDGTDPIAFLSYYTKSDLRVSRGEKSEKRGIIFANDLRDGYWDYSRSKIIFSRRNKSGKTTIIENIPTQFMDAMMVCIREIEVHKKVRKILRQRKKLASLNVTSEREKDTPTENKPIEEMQDSMDSQDNDVIVPVGNVLSGKRGSISKLIAPKVDFNKLLS
ncbi:hypothetical protein FG386_002047 [Cryptosporidium ryanae]|uniref:uncharacterized protein n=1 Tax=Cryptosporidium ryanae TaxID=515981 RepID=UPI00351A3B8C|nr:hypothetical protein FG386_002047 [Cryptosporidium ryanae]